MCGRGRGVESLRLSNAHVGMTDHLLKWHKSVFDNETNFCALVEASESATAPSQWRHVAEHKFRSTESGGWGWVGAVGEWSSLRLSNALAIVTDLVQVE